MFTSEKEIQQDIQGIDHKPKSHCRHAIVVGWLVQRRNHCLQIHQILHISTGTLGEKFAPLARCNAQGQYRKFRSKCIATRPPV